MDMLHQEPSYAEYAYTHGLIPLGAKLKFEKDWENCLEKVSTMMVGVVVVSWCGVVVVDIVYVTVLVIIMVGVLVALLVCYILLVEFMMLLYRYYLHYYYRCIWTNKPSLF